MRIQIQQAKCSRWNLENVEELFFSTPGITNPEVPGSRRMFRPITDRTIWGVRRWRKSSRRLESREKNATTQNWLILRSTMSSQIKFQNLQQQLVPTGVDKCYTDSIDIPLITSNNEIKEESFKYSRQQVNAEDQK